MQGRGAWHRGAGRRGVGPFKGLVVEAVLTFLLVNTVLQTFIAGKGKDFASLAIGLAPTFVVLMGGLLTGASLNPARTLGPAIFTGKFDNLWVYFVGPFLGAALAVTVYRFLRDRK